MSVQGVARDRRLRGWLTPRVRVLAFLPFSMAPSRLVIAIIVLCVYAIALPVRLPRGGGGGAVADADCLTLVDRAPQARGDVVATLEHCAALHPDDVELLADLGAAYETREAPARAIEMYRRALTIDPAYADVRLRLGRLLLQRGAAAAARQEADAALRVQPNRQALLDLQRDADRRLAASPTPAAPAAERVARPDARVGALR